MIRQLLQREFPDCKSEITNFSEEHAGHAGAGLETHFRVKIIYSGFQGMTRVAMHKAVNKALAPAFDAGLHALQIDVKAA